jgi:hypothetical protein
MTDMQWAYELISRLRAGVREEIDWVRDRDRDHRDRDLDDQRRRLLRLQETLEQLAGTLDRVRQEREERDEWRRQALSLPKGRSR